MHPSRGLNSLAKQPAGTRDEVPDRGPKPEREKVPGPNQQSGEMDFGV